MSIEKELSATSQLGSKGLPSFLPIGTLDRLDNIVDEINNIAKSHRTDPLALLQLLRILERLHRDIQQEYFQSALPNNRQALYSLLRDIEEQGGWPYIQRWKLQALLANLPPEEDVG